ncbi:MAG: hypothetical protein ACK52E_16445 [Aphanizomenon sp.]|jgi:hypothetical protein
MDYVIYEANIGYLCDYEKSTEKGNRASVKWDTRKTPKLFTIEQARNWIEILNKYTRGRYLIINRTQSGIGKREMIKAA